MRTITANPTLSETHLQNIVNLKFGESVLWFNRAHAPELWFTLCEDGQVYLSEEDKCYLIGSIELSDTEKVLLRDRFISKTGDLDHLGEHYFCLNWSAREELHISFDLMAEIERELTEIAAENEKHPFKIEVKTDGNT